MVRIDIRANADGSRFCIRGVDQVQEGYTTVATFEVQDDVGAEVLANRPMRSTLLDVVAAVMATQDIRTSLFTLETYRDVLPPLIEAVGAYRDSRGS